MEELANEKCNPTNYREIFRMVILVLIIIVLTGAVWADSQNYMDTGVFLVLSLLVIGFFSRISSIKFYDTMLWGVFLGLSFQAIDMQPELYRGVLIENVVGKTIFATAFGVAFTTIAKLLDMLLPPWHEN